MTDTDRKDDLHFGVVDSSYVGYNYILVPGPLGVCVHVGHHIFDEQVWGPYDDEETAHAMAHRIHERMVNGEL